jgi:hypothetical protein
MRRRRAGFLLRCQGRGGLGKGNDSQRPGHPDEARRIALPLSARLLGHIGHGAFKYPPVIAFPPTVTAMLPEEVAFPT